MADAATTDPADQDPISQTFTAGNAVNAKTFIDLQSQYANISLAEAQSAIRDANEYRNNLRSYNLQALQRGEVMNNQALAMVTAINTQAAKVVLDQTSDALADAISGMQGVKAGQSTPPVYQDPTNGATGPNGASTIALLSQLVQLLTAKGTTTA